MEIIDFEIFVLLLFYLEINTELIRKERIRRKKKREEKYKRNESMKRARILIEV